MIQQPQGRTGIDAWYQPEGLTRLYDQARSHVPGGGPPLQIFRTVSGFVPVPGEIEEGLVWLFERALVRTRFPPGSTIPAVAVRIDFEVVPGERRSELAVRVFDTGPVSDPRDAHRLEEFPGQQIEVRREPPTGPWNGVVAMRLPLDSPPGGRVV